ncbi:MAG: hypothetical protein AB8G96_03115 [Phycisphaerales bacterium]
MLRFRRYPAKAWLVRAAWIALAAIHVLPLVRCMEAVRAAFEAGHPAVAGPIAAAGVLAGLIGLSLLLAVRRPRGLGNAPRTAQNRWIAGLLAITIAHHDALTDAPVAAATLEVALPLGVAVAGLRAARRVRWRRRFAQWWRAATSGAGHPAPSVLHVLCGQVEALAAHGSPVSPAGCSTGPRGPPLAG